MLGELPEENMTILGEIARERQRQIDVEGWTPEHDDTHTEGELAKAAAIYALYASSEGRHRAAKRYAEAGRAPAGWPWSPEWWKPKTRHYDLIRATALLHAEIERQHRLTREPKPPEPKS